MRRRIVQLSGSGLVRGARNRRQSAARMYVSQVFSVQLTILSDRPRFHIHFCQRFRLPFRRRPEAMIDFETNYYVVNQLSVASARGRLCCLFSEFIMILTEGVRERNKRLQNNFPTAKLRYGERKCW